MSGTRVIKIVFFSVLSLMSMSGAFSVASAQTTEVTAFTGYTPYSMYGMGDIARQGTTFNRTMGGIGIGIRNERFINTINPASITEREQKSFMLDFGLQQNNVYYAANAASAVGTSSDDVLRSVNNTFNMHHFVVSFPIYTHSAFKVGIMPYTNVGYKFISPEQDDDLIAEMGDIKYVRSGYGGIYKTFVGAAVTLFDHLSAGADFHYYFGTIDRCSNAYFTTESSYCTITTGWEDVVRGVSGQLGLQYEAKLGSKLSLVAGVTYKFANRFKGEETRYGFGESTLETDTVVWNATKIDWRIPSEMGLGISVGVEDKWVAGFDYTRQNFSGCKFSEIKGLDLDYTCAESFKFGFEITPDRYDLHSFMKHLTYKVGAYHDKSYIALNGHQISSMGFTLGFSIPVFRYYNSLTFGVDFGQRGTLKYDLIRERYFMFTMAFSMHDIWFIKPLYQ